jgi:hypothetical protein
MADAALMLLLLLVDGMLQESACAQRLRRFAANVHVLLWH